ncbi:JAB domain-containing protein [Luteolibacter sp. SL250]|uniref:JAB domain-containing protein n=1 Tax=Luteolibacter sp. SL250 TaxID=2995170 RepID=UPI00226DEF1C|nr:JAB domain-containing protein [Luteolibacter sp. SL250]WAC19031.1 JAB domain-containing protein [Luteolibacter sp. SL250]
MRFIVQDFRTVSVDEAPFLTFHDFREPEEVYRFYKEVVEKDRGYEPEKEHVVVLAVNSRGRLMGWHLVSTGGFSEASCHPREVLRPIIVRAAPSFILCHNHPSGDPSPSRADETVTKRIREASSIFQIDLVDHVIIGRPLQGRSPYFSFRDTGFL